MPVGNGDPGNHHLSIIHMFVFGEFPEQRGTQRDERVVVGVEEGVDEIVGDLEPHVLIVERSGLAHQAHFGDGKGGYVSPFRVIRNARLRPMSSAADSGRPSLIGQQSQALRPVVATVDHGPLFGPTWSSTISSTPTT